MKKVVIDARMIVSSGIGTYLQNLLPSIKNEFEIVLLGDKEKLGTFTWADGLRIIEFDSPIYSLSEQFFLPLKIPACDIFLSPHYNIPVMQFSAKKRAVIIHDVYHLAFYDRLTGPQKLYSRFMINNAVKKSDIILTVSNFSKSEIIKYTGAEESRIEVIYFGLNQSDFQYYDNGFTEKIKKKYGLPEKYFLFVSNIKPHKNLYNLLLAFLSLTEKGNDYRLAVVGEYEKLITTDKEVFNLLDKEPELKEKIIFTGYAPKTDLPGLYMSAQALIFPSLYEGFGLPPLEAMACGCPVIASNAASVPEACGEAALYFNPRSPSDIAEKIQTFLSDGRIKDELTIKGKENIKRFSLKIFSENFKNVFNR